MEIDGNQRPHFSEKELEVLKRRSFLTDSYNKMVFRFVKDTRYFAATRLSMSQLVWLWKIKDSLRKSEKKESLQVSLPF